MLNKEQREMRFEQLGASDIHKLFNFDNKGAIDLWREKVDRIEKDDFTTQSMTAGNLLEEDCLKFYFDTHGIKDYILNERLEHKQIKSFVVSLDGRFNDIPVENKTMKYEKFINLKEPERCHMIQLQAQMCVLESEKGIILYNAVNDFHLEYPLLYKPNEVLQEAFEVERDDELIREIESRATYFLWCVEFKREPRELHYQRQAF